MEKQLTTIEWLVENTALKHLQHICLDEINQAKEMEKERMVNFAKYCLNNAKYLNFDKALFNVEEYYQIFKSK